MGLGAGTAHATAGTAFAESSRVAALASSVTAREGDATTMLQNPAGLADLDEAVLMLSSQAGLIDAYFARDGEPRQERDRWLGGFGVAVGTPLPGPAWLRRVRLGFALHFPAAHALRVTVAERTDQPTSPIDDARPERMSAVGSLAVELLPWLRLGAGAAILPTLSTPGEVTYVAGRTSSPESDAVVRVERDLRMGVAPLVGLRLDPVAWLAIGAAYRAEQVSGAGGTNRTVAGGVLADDPIDYLSFWDPAELALGVALHPSRRWSLSSDVVWSRWSTFRDGFDQPLSHPLSDVWSVRTGAEWKPEPWVAFRLGSAWEPTPVPDQLGQTNYLDADTLVAGLGAGLDVRRLTDAPLALDVHLRARVGGEQHAHKSVSALPDADPGTPGQQLDNLGYPGFSSRSRMFQAGLTLTLFIGKERK